MKKIFAVIPIFCIFVLCLDFSGCAKKGDPNTIVLWHWMTDRDEAIKALAKKYEELTNVKVKVELFAPSDSYTKRIVASAQAKVLPDIYGILDKKEFFASFIKNGYVADLTEDFKKDNAAWESSLFPKALEVNRFPEGNVNGVKPGIYGVPLDVTNIQMLYNKELLAKAGIKSPPITFAEFIDAVEALNRVGITGLVSGWGEMWMVDCFASNYAFNIMGEEKIMATYKGEVPYTDPDWIKVFNVFKTLKDKGALASGIVIKQNKYAEQDFALGRAAFAFNGSWCVNVYNGMNPHLKYGAMLPPAINSENPMKIWGGAGSSFVVNASSKKKDKAIAFLKWLTDKDQQVFLATETKNLPANRNALSAIPDILSEFARVMDYTTHPTIWKYNEFPQVTDEFDKGIQSIIIGDMTPEEVAKKVQAVKESEMIREKRNQSRKSQQ